MKLQRCLFIAYIISVTIILAGCRSKKAVVVEPTVTHHHGYPQYESAQWVRNMSKPFSSTHGLANRHIAVAASHGKYYNHTKGKWEWQRPYMNDTREDLYTRTIVTPYLIPMLENAGATVFSPRERDEQTEEVVVKAPVTMKAKKTPSMEQRFTPRFRKAGSYAVYVKYPKHSMNVPDAIFSVYHGGMRTDFTVNQRMGQGTWVYLGTFRFEAGETARNSVLLTNMSYSDGYVTAEAVRFGGGKGSIRRGGTVSGEPRCLEAARYTAEYYGAPDSVWSRFKNDDYKDDIVARPRMVNWLAGGSCYNPNEQGLNVPIEMFLAIHSDAGKNKDNSLVGTLAICTTNTGDGKLGSGAPRTLSKELAQSIADNIGVDIPNAFGTWNVRGVWDKNYGETRIPVMPSVIVETLSHENPADMRLGHNPDFRFTLARSIYKTVLRFLSKQHGFTPIVQPLPPKNLTIFPLKDGRLQVQWQEQEDASEPTAKPSAYIVYIATSGTDYDNGTLIKGNAIAIQPKPGTTYHFKVSAVNNGGESLPVELSY